MLARFERMMERAVEGSLRRVFSAELQPVQLAKAAARAMEEAQVVGPWGPEVANAYVLRVSPGDMARFAPYRATLTRELSRYLADYARDRGLRPVGELRVEIEEHEATRTGLVQVDARFVDVEPERRAALTEALDSTRQLRLAAAGQSRPGAGWLVDPAGHQHPLDVEAGIVRIGRSADNDVVLPDPRISRYHAQLRWSGGQWRVHDLESTNGTSVDGESIDQAGRLLRPGDVVRLADLELTYRVEGDRSPQ